MAGCQDFEGLREENWDNHILRLLQMVLINLCSGIMVTSTIMVFGDMSLQGGLGK